MENYFFLENYGTSEGAVSHNVLYYQPLPITRYKVRFYANHYFEQLPIVFTVFKLVNKNYEKSPNITKPNTHFKVRGTLNWSAQINCHQGHIATNIWNRAETWLPPSQSLWWGCRHWHHPLGAWLPLERNSLPPNLLVLWGKIKCLAYGHKCHEQDSNPHWQHLGPISWLCSL